MKRQINTTTIMFTVILGVLTINTWAAKTNSDTDLAFPASAAAAALADEEVSVSDSVADSQPLLPVRVPRMRTKPPAKKTFAFNFVVPQSAELPVTDALVRDTARFSYYSRVYSLPAPTSPQIGIVTDTGTYLVQGEEGGWYCIEFQKQQGWVQKTNAYSFIPAHRPSIEASSESTLTSAIIRISSQAQLTAQRSGVSVWVLILRHPILISLIAGAALLAFLAGFLLQRKGPQSVKRQVSTIALASKKILMAGGHQRNVRRALTDETIPIETALSEAGFAVSVFEELEQLGEALGILIPSLIAVDCRGNIETINKTERLLMRRVTLVNVPVLFFNVPGSESAPRSAILPNAICIGVLPTDWDVLKAINQLHSVDGSPRAIRKSIGSSILQGSIKGERLSELFAYLETGKRTGCLLVEHDTHPFGMVYFDKGRIVSAQTKDQRKQTAAAVAVLELTSGTFRFIADRTSDTPNCDLAPTGIMLEWTKRVDETQHMAAIKPAIAAAKASKKHKQA